MFNHKNTPSSFLNKRGSNTPSSLPFRPEGLRRGHFNTQLHDEERLRKSAESGVLKREIINEKSVDLEKSSCLSISNRRKIITENPDESEKIFSSPTVTAGSEKRKTEVKIENGDSSGPPCQPSPSATQYASVSVSSCWSWDDIFTTKNITQAEGI